MSWDVPGLGTGEIREILRESGTGGGTDRRCLGDRLLWRRCAGGAVEIVDIVVRSERGKGRGTQLINQLKQTVKTHLIFAFVRESNELAIRFYKKNGFERLGAIKDFYREESAVVMGIRSCQSE